MTDKKNIQKSWYKSKAMRWILILTANILALSISFDVLFIHRCPQEICDSTSWNEIEKPYEESAAFEDLFSYASRSAMSSVRSKINFETEGRYNAHKIVDVMEYAESGKISGENKNGLAYTVEQLDGWEDIYPDTDIRDDTIVVCQKLDNTYYYYYLKDFKEQLSSGKLRLENTNMTVDTFLDTVEEHIPTTSDDGIMLADETGKVLYESFWRFPYTITEKYKPVGAENIVEVVNNTPELNGKLTEIYDALQQMVEELNGDLESYRYSDDMWEEGNTNFTYMLVDKNKKLVYTNNGAFKRFEDVNTSLAKLKSENRKYIIVKDKLLDFDTNMNISKQQWRNTIRSYYKGNKSDYLFAASVNTEYKIQDIFYMYKQEYNYYNPHLKRTILSIALSVSLLLVNLVWLAVITGEKNKEGEIILTTFDHWKTEISVLLIVLFWYIPFVFALSVFGNQLPMAVGRNQLEYEDIVNVQQTKIYLYYNPRDYALISILTVFTMICFLIIYLSIVRRKKAGILWKNSIIHSLNHGFKVFWRGKSEIAKAVLLLTGFLAFHWIAWLFITLGNFASIVVLFIMIILDMMSAYVVFRDAIAKKKIRAGVEELAKGNMEYQIPTGQLKGENKELAEEVNDIGKGLHKAVDSAMKSERLKTDLITNVSHDIKTPLTSIINYVDLLKRENFEDPKVLGYLDILSEKAMRLKTLTEDVVEASKVSSGNITLEYMDVNFVEMINQTEGELLEKFEENNLLIVQNLPEESVVIHVDGRRMWRILENIYTNALKYAMPGTRVYSELQVKEEKVIFSLKNISRQQLNFTADELTERFIRGDISRGSEGSGLGLSIAKSLTKMQGGVFNLYLDGDLFKVMLEFPRVK